MIPIDDDRNRCTAKAPDGRRCQLFLNHSSDQPHAHAWQVRHSATRRGHYGLTDYMICWRDDGLEPWSEVPGDRDRVPWCCMNRVDAESA